MYRRMVHQYKITVAHLGAMVFEYFESILKHFAPGIIKWRLVWKQEGFHNVWKFFVYSEILK